MVAKYLPAHIPGNPSIIIRQMTAGGGIVGCNYVYNVAEPDGLTILGGSPTSWMLNFLRPEGVNFKLEEMPGLLNLTDSSLIYSDPKVIDDVRDMFTTKKGLKFGSIGPVGFHGMGFLAMADLLGMEITYVWGYKGFATERLALLNGEIDLAAGAVIADVRVVKSYIESGEMMRLLQTGKFDAEGNVVGDPSIPDVPTVTGLYEELYGEPPSGAKWETFKTLYIFPRAASRPTVLPPGTPDYILEILTEAVRDMLKDPIFQEAFNKTLPGSPPIQILQDAPDPWRKICTPSPEVYASAQRLVAPHGMTLK